ncbi:hypothetical protein AVEN_150229-1 [Araneus ventricosus]|uniref:Uncharacterized protein n=1 Tax=Araneus ventricosus TaxID=182803 RepID=A0A4Y2G7T7_ARAVE|nr:hypothetical protein AVEN_150229-1 [Araneus ventricosus]
MELEMEAKKIESTTGERVKSSIDMRNPIQKFDPKVEDISLYQTIRIESEESKGTQGVVGFKSHRFTSQLHGPEIKEHFIDEWPKLKSLELFSEKLDQYESLRNMMKNKTTSHDHKEKHSSFQEKTSARVGSATKKLKVLSGRKSAGVIIALPRDIFVLAARN